VNKKRDRRTGEIMRQEGWNLITIWECALKGRRRLAEVPLVERLSSAIQGPPGIYEIAGTIDHTCRGHPVPEVQNAPVSHPASE
jgi:DNA mismatch endonuclease (patch repair protein)